MSANVTNITANATEENESNSTTPYFSRITAPTVVVNNDIALVTTASNNCCIGLDNSSLDFRSEKPPTTGPAFTVTNSENELQKTIWSLDELSNYSPYEDRYFAPTWLILLNFCLIIFLVIVLGVALYPAVRKYCDSTFFSNRRGSSRYWIEDNEEVASILTSDIPECSFALLNHNRATTTTTTARQPIETTPDSSSASSVDIFVETPDSIKQSGD